MEQKQQQLWGGRFDEALNGDMQDFNSSIHIDKRLALADVRCSQAYCTALFECDILNHAEHERIQEGLKAIGEEWTKGEFQINYSSTAYYASN